MEIRTAGESGGEGTAPKPETSTRRRKRNRVDSKARYFLPKQGSSLKSLELGQEMPSEGDALIQALKHDQHFYVLTVWKAVTEQDGGNPVIIKQPIADPRAE